MKTNQHRLLLSSLTAAVLLPAASPAATIIAGPISTLGTAFLLDTATTGGGDTVAAASVTFNRNLSATGSLVVGGGPQSVSITGFGFATQASGTTATTAVMTVTYLGADGVSGGGDDVAFGSVTDSYTFGAAGTYVWNFDTPLTQTIDAASGSFLFNITSSGTGNFRFKTTTGTGLGATKLTVAGTATPVPEAAPASLAALIGIGLLLRRRN